MANKFTRESQNKDNYNISLRKEWFDKRLEKNESCWIDWEKEAEK
jgi:hypothetical protein